MWKQVHTIGSATCILLILLWLASIIKSTDPAYKVSSESFLIQGGMVGLAILGLLGFRANQAWVAVLAGLASFFPIGFYLLGTPSIFRFIGVLDLIMVALGGVLFITKIVQKPNHSVSKSSIL